MRTRTQDGFTLIELMIVVAIIAILAALATSQYQDYIARSQFSEATVFADGLKTDIARHVNETAQCPTNSTIGFLSAVSYSGAYVASATLAGSPPACTLTVTFRNTSVSAPLQGNSVVLTSTPIGGVLQWTCSSSTIAARYLPQTCR